MQRQVEVASDSIRLRLRAETEQTSRSLSRSRSRDASEPSPQPIQFQAKILEVCVSAKRPLCMYYIYFKHVKLIAFDYRFDASCCPWPLWDLIKFANLFFSCCFVLFRFWPTLHSLFTVNWINHS